MVLLDPPPAGGIEDEDGKGKYPERQQTGIFHERLLKKLMLIP
jgi:hypothetical protein